MQVQKPVRKCLKLGEIRLEVDLQSRVNIDRAVVDEYREALLAGEKLPAVNVVFDGVYYYLTDGFHRFHATKAAGLGEIDVDCLKGSLRDAKLASVGANSKHGLRRTNDDKRRAVMMLLDDEEWAVWSAREIAKACCVSHDFVARIKSQLSSDDSEKEVSYVTKHGTEAVMKTASIGKTSEKRGADLKSDYTSASHKDEPSEPGSTPTGDLSDALGAHDEATAAAMAEPTATPGDPDFDAYIEGLHDTIAELRRDNEALSATDQGAELLKHRQLLLHAENTARTATEQLVVREKSLTWFGKRFDELRKLLGVKSDRDVVGAVRLLTDSKK